MQRDEEGIIKNICGGLENTADTLSLKYHKSGMLEFLKTIYLALITPLHHIVYKESYKLTESNLIFPEFHQKY